MPHRLCHKSITRYILTGLLVLLIPVLADASVWYVDKDAVGTNAGTSWTNAWHGFDHVVWGGAGVVAGDTLYISGGSVSKTYTATGEDMFIVGASGSAGNLITIATGAKSPSPSGHDGLVVFDGNGYGRQIVSQRNYIKFDGEKNGVINWNIHNGSRDSYDKKALSINSGGTTTGNIVTYIYIYDVMTGIDAGGSSNAASALEISHCTIKADGYAGIVASGDACTGFGCILIHHNDLYCYMDPSKAKSGNDAIKTGIGTDIYNNTFTTISQVIANPVEHPDFIQTSAINLRAWNNVFDQQGYDGVQTFAHETSQQQVEYSQFALIYNNVFKRIGGVVIAHGLNAGEDNPDYVVGATWIVANNNFVDGGYSTSQYPIGLGFTAVTFVPTVLIKNNIIYNSGWGTGTQAVFINLQNIGQLAGITFSNNAVNAGEHGSSLVQYHVSTNQNLTQTNTQTGAPTFTTYTEYSGANVYALQAASIGLDQGDSTGLTGYFTTDILGNARSGTWDIGAYEYMAPAVGTITGITISPGVVFK
jgi:hypothetical protein